jgi:hypothetical protein
MVDHYTLGLARRNGEAADSWMEYARDLERKLATEKASNAAARVLGTAVINELTRIDPANPLANKENRQRIFDQAYRNA